MLSPSFPIELQRKSRKKRENLGLSLEEYVLDLVLTDLDPVERAREYIEVAKDLLGQAEEELAKGDIRQAAEKLWSAAALTIKACAEYREGRRLGSHKELWEYMGIMVSDFGPWIREAWMFANAMHTCFYEGWCAKEDVVDALKKIRKLVAKIGESVQKHS